jgi:hypothetical protein
MSTLNLLAVASISLAVIAAVLAIAVGLYAHRVGRQRLAALHADQTLAQMIMVRLKHDLGLETTHGDRVDPVKDHRPR